MTHSSPRSFLRTALWCITFVILAPAVKALGPVADVPALLAAINAEPSERAYAHVRQLWSLWGETDPDVVEEALVQVASSPRLAPPVRAYAEFFLSRSQTRRGDLAGARASVKNLGYVTDWLVAGPFDNEGKAGLDTEVGPETHWDRAILPGQVYTGKERPVAYRATPSGAFPHGWLDGGALFRPDQNICYVATTFLTTETKQTLSLWLGNSGAVKWFIDGVEVLKDPAVRGYDADRHGILVEMAAGVHNVSVKLCGQNNAPVVSLRVAQKNGAGPAPKGVSTSNALEQSSLSVANHRAVRVLATNLGPLAKLRAQAEQRRASPAALDAFADYLVHTVSDDPAVHQARDVAKQAAEQAPTVERLLFAGELSEDYNQERAWLARAERLHGNKPPTLELSLARARVERSGLNWRDAFPHYRDALKLNPRSYAALRGVVELYNEVGLRHTALRALEDALREEPNAVNVLNMYASQLTALGFHAEAELVEARYATLRFDDTAFLSSRVELGLAQRDRAAVEHWVNRLLALSPDNQWAYGVAAQAYRQLGQPERARTTLEEALRLAPEDVSTLRALSDLFGELGERDEQLRLLRRILELRPQAKDIREYVEHILPEEPKADEAYAWAPERFLEKRHLDAAGEVRRTLLELKVSTVYENGLGSEFHQVVFQPLNDSAAALSRRYVFGYEADSQRVELRGARVYRADGRIDEAIETGTDSADDPSIAMYTSMRAYYVQFPRLDPGDVVELQYRIDDVAVRNDYDTYFGALETLQSNEPVGHAEYVLIAPKARKLYIEAKGIPGLKQKATAKGDQTIYRFWADDLPPIIPEPSMPPWREVAGHIHVSTYKDYKELGKWYWGLVRDQFNLDQETRQLAQKITKGLTTDREKVAAVYNWVIKNTRYVALEFGIYGHKPRRCVQTVARGWGDCKDKATVIVSLLEELGIDATFVILRTQMRGRFDSAVASLSPFDHAIAYVPSLNLYLDGTAEFTGSTELPAMDQESLGILVNRGDAQLVTLPLLAAETGRSTTTRAKLKLDGSGDIELEAVARGATAPEWRRRYSAADRQRERVSQDVSQIVMGFQLNAGPGALVVDADDYEKPVRVVAKGKTDTLARVDGDELSVHVTIRRRLSDQYASLVERQLPVRLPVFGTEHSEYELELPPGSVVVSGPQDVSHKSKFGEYHIKRVQDGRKVRVTSSLSLSTTRIKPEEYKAWRQFCEAADSAMATRLVVRRQ
jgi:tetratricopeptide (TPR) repeat protein